MGKNGEYLNAATKPLSEERNLSILISVSPDVEKSITKLSFKTILEASSIDIPQISS